jgi:hypothetical protein
MRSALLFTFCFIVSGCSADKEPKGGQELPTTREDGGTDEQGFDPDNPIDAGDGMTGKPDAGGDGDGDSAMTGCTPGAEICGDGLDNDCDELADERCGCNAGAEQPCYDGPQALAGVGQCAFGAQACVSTEEFSSWGACEGAGLPMTELCGNMLDDDCDGKSDEGCVCEPGETRPCYGGSSATRGVGACMDGALSCLAEGDEGAWSDACEGQVTPDAELCGNDVDEDCDGNLDNGCGCDTGDSDPCYSGAEATRGVGACEDGTRTCEVSDGVATWSGCEGDVTPATEVCGNEVDEDCDGELDNDCSELACPADITVPAGDIAALLATGSGVSNYAFTITAGPAGGAATAIWGGLVSSSPSAQLTPIIVGEYTVQITALNGAGDPLSCSFRVTALPHGLRVQLYWDGNGDVDLHLLNPMATRWSLAPNDTFYQNRTSTWGAALDVDNVTANGPENITVDDPVVGTTYTIGVHHFARATGRIASVSVFCGDTTSTTPQQTWTSRPLMGTEMGLCMANDFWRVARITFTSPSACTIEPIDTYFSAIDSCMGL